MAKPQRQGLTWLPVPTDLFTDTIAAGLRTTFGTHALSVRMALVLSVAKQGYFAPFDKSMLFTLCDQLPGITPKEIEEIVCFLVSNGEYDQATFDEHQVLTSSYLQDSWLRSKKGRRNVENAPYWLPLSPENQQMLKRINGAHYDTNRGIMAPVMPSDTPIMESITPHNIYNNNIINIHNNTSTNVDDYIADDDADKSQENQDSNFPVLDREINTLSADTPWLDQLQTSFSMPRSDILELLTKFRAACIERGKVAHRSIADAKAHFVNWRQRSSYSSTPETPANKPNANNHRPSSRRTAPPSPDFGLVQPAS